MNSSQYLEQRKLSAWIDELLGFEIVEIENALVRALDQTSDDATLQSEKNKIAPIQLDCNELSNEQAWIGLNPDALQTTYAEFFEIIEYIQNSDSIDSNDTKEPNDTNKANISKTHRTWLDFGAAYGRLGIALHQKLKNNYQFIGYEILELRVKEAKRIYDKHQMQNNQMILQNLSDPNFEVPKADVCFIYDSGTGQAIEQMIELARRSKAQFIVGRGGSTRTRIERHHPWLSQIHEPKHFENYSIYRAY